MVYLEPCFKNSEGGYPQLFMAGVVPYKPSSTQVLIVAHLDRQLRSFFLFLPHALDHPKTDRTSG